MGYISHDYRKEQYIKVKTEKSATMCLYPIVSAIDKADDMLGKDRIWVAINGRQEPFIHIFENIRGETRSMKEIKCIASMDAGEINRFLQEEGFQFMLDPFKKGEFGTASVMDILVEWLTDGHTTEITSDRDGVSIFPGVILKTGVSFVRSSYHDQPIVVIETKSGDKVYMMAHSRLEDMKLIARVNGIMSMPLNPISEFEGIHFPQVYIDQKVDISWLERLWTRDDNGRNFEIAKILQQTKFRMNEKGARAQSAVATKIRPTCVRITHPLLIINEPFLIWISRPGLRQPLFTGWISEEDWKTPKNISQK